MTIIQYDIRDMFERIEGLEDLIKIDVFRDVFRSGGYIAGGFARFLLREKSVKKVIKHVNNLWASGPKMDIDIFFDSLERSRALISNIATYERTNSTLIPSLGNNAQQCYISIALNEITDHSELEPTEIMTMMVQFITGFIGSPRDMISRFDITNCKVGFNDEYFWIDDRVEKLEKDLVLHISDISKFVPSRIRKYLVHRGYRKIHPESVHVLAGWMEMKLVDERVIDVNVKQKYRQNINAIINLAKTHPDLVSNRMLMDLISYVDDRRLQAISYSYLDKPFDETRIFININPAVAALRERKCESLDLKMGDMIEIDEPSELLDPSIGPRRVCVTVIESNKDIFTVKSNETINNQTKVVKTPESGIHCLFPGGKILRVEPYTIRGIIARANDMINDEDLSASSS